MMEQNRKRSQEEILNQYSDKISTNESKLSGKKKRYLVIMALVFYGQAVSICCSIRYGFLVDSFASRGVPGKIYGLVESSLFIGYAGIFFSGLTERAMKKFNSRDLLAGIMVGFFVLQLGTGFAYHLQDNLAVITLSFLMRILQGIFTYPSYLVPLDFIQANFQNNFDFVNGILNVGYFSGHGLAEVFGCILYDHLGYEVAYVFTAAVALLSVVVILLIVPKTNTYLSMEKSTPKDEEVPDIIGSNKTKLTKFLLIPMLCTMCINANYGVLQVTVTPFLKEEFHKSISYGGTVLMLVSLGMATGSFSAGLLLQKKILNTFTVMAVGASSVCLGLILTFPPTALPAMYDMAPIIAFPGVFLAGFGDPLMTIATLRALCDLQELKRGTLTPKVVTRITGIWLIGYCCMYYLGSFIAGVLRDYLSYSDTAAVLAVVCFVAVLICITMRCNFTTGADEDEEKKPLI